MLTPPPSPKRSRKWFWAAILGVLLSAGATFHYVSRIAEYDDVIAMDEAAAARGEPPGEFNRPEFWRERRSAVMGPAFTAGLATVVLAALAYGAWRRA